MKALEGRRALYGNPTHVASLPEKTELGPLDRHDRCVRFEANVCLEPMAKVASRDKRDKSSDSVVVGNPIPDNAHPVCSETGFLC